MLDLPKNPELRAASDPEDAAARVKLIERAICSRDRVRQYLADVAYWNEHIRKPHEALIDADPTGEVAQCLAYYDALISKAVD